MGEEGEVDVVNGQDEKKPEEIDNEEKELDELKKKVQQMQEEASRLEEIQKEVEAQMGVTPGSAAGDPDARSVYIGNVDYASTPEELQSHFQSCGPVARVTILCDRYTGHPKGFAYIEFGNEAAVANAIQMNDTFFRQRQIKVSPKRTNLPGFQMGRGAPGGRGFRGRFRGRGAPRGRGGMPFPNYYHPYV
eukprot:TRINITY_DN1754_c0_g1_i1.p1 TRINITY_DN1754_c0_g1~~TRINITY_DN1754_c0_g1_i1.p1  ORF type:complete len:191 (+),score=38.58 TRINITY_DN1754_c0_g1_i1:10-582(+)